MQSQKTMIFYTRSVQMLAISMVYSEIKKKKIKVTSLEVQTIGVVLGGGWQFIDMKKSSNQSIL